MFRIVVFVHGFRSKPACWDPFLNLLKQDERLAREGFLFKTFEYKTSWLDLNLIKRIPSIAECGNCLGGFLDELPECDEWFLVGHSMGGLVIQSLLASKIQKEKGRDLAKIRSVILFATPNRGSIVARGVRSIFRQLWETPQEDNLDVFDKEMAEVSDVIVRHILEAKQLDASFCPIPFRAFWGLEDDVVPEVSARGPFAEASALPGGHSEIIQPEDANDLRYKALNRALLHPLGHPTIYDIDLVEFCLAIQPVAPGKKFTLSGPVRPIEVYPDNVAIRRMKIQFSKENRCNEGYEQVYRSKDGYVELLSLTEPNEANAIDQSTYYEGGKMFTYLFTPESGKTFDMNLRIFNGFGDMEQTWHNHMKANARYKLFRFTLDLTAYRNADYELSQMPLLYFHPKNIVDHALCIHRVDTTPLPHLPSTDPWCRTWDIVDVRGGVVDLVWHVSKPS